MYQNLIAKLELFLVEKKRKWGIIKHGLVKKEFDYYIIYGIKTHL